MEEDKEGFVITDKELINTKLQGILIGTFIGVIVCILSALLTVRYI